MTTGWTAGNGVGLTWTAAFNTTDFTTCHSSGLMQNLDVVLSSVADITNGTALDKFADLSLELSIASSTIGAGASFTFWLYALLDNGTSYGDGQQTAGIATTKTPAFAPCAIMPLYATTGQISLVGFFQGIVIPPGSFRFAIQNNCGFTLTNTTTTCKYRTYF